MTTNNHSYCFILKVELLMFELFAANWRRFRVSCDIVGPGTSTCGPSLLFIGDGNDRNPDDQSSTTERLPCLPFHASIRLQEVHRLSQRLSNRKFTSAKGSHQPGENNLLGLV